ncbi:MAG: S66 peptidase family protein [Bacteroidales bacterium]
MHKPLSVLKKGDKIAIVAPAGKVDKKSLEKGLSILQSWGLEPDIAENVFGKNSFFSSSDEKRIQDFQKALDNDEYKAIFYARGGYGSARIIQNIDWTHFVKNPKWVLGYSDATIILSKIQQLGFPCIHSPMPASFDKYKENDSLSHLKSLLFDGKYRFSLPKENIEIFSSNTAFQYIITGGNLSLLQTTIGTSFQPDTKNKLLFIEDVGEYEYRVDRMIFHLYHAGMLENVKGIILGTFNFIKDSKIFPFSIIETLKAFKLKNLEFIIKNFPTGHDKFNYPIVLGNQIKINLKNNVEIEVLL